jgi:hypothetical protein
MVILAEDPEWDIALLGVGDSSEAFNPDKWLRPTSPSPVIAGLGTSSEADCETTGFPQSEVQRGPDGNLYRTIRQTEQASGRLAPAGEGKKPLANRQLPLRWMPLDLWIVRPLARRSAGAAFGCGVLLGDGRLVGIVVASEAGPGEDEPHPVARFLASAQLGNNSLIARILAGNEALKSIWIFHLRLSCCSVLLSWPPGPHVR